jgi:hypothetical protein
VANRDHCRRTPTPCQMQAVHFHFKNMNIRRDGCCNKIFTFSGCTLFYFLSRRESLTCRRLVFSLRVAKSLSAETPVNSDVNSMISLLFAMGNFLKCYQTYLPQFAAELLRKVVIHMHFGWWTLRLFPPLKNDCIPCLLGQTIVAMDMSVKF